MNKVKIKSLLTLLLIALPILTGCGTNNTNVGTRTLETDEEATVPIGSFAPEIVGKDVNGKAIKLSDYSGKVVMLDFFGNW